MKKNLVLLLICFLSYSSGGLFSQNLTSGDLSVLKGQTLINIRFDYSKMKVGDYDPEDEYKSAFKFNVIGEDEFIKKSVDAMNNKKAGSGEEWAAKWQRNKTELYHPGFEAAFNEKAMDCSLEVKENEAGAKYTMIVHVDFLEQGIQSRQLDETLKLASVNLTIDVVETAAPETILASIESTKNINSNNSNVNKNIYDPGWRLTNCYKAAGKSIAKFICKKLK